MRIIRRQLAVAEARVAIAGARAALQRPSLAPGPCAVRVLLPPGALPLRHDAGTFFICLANTR